LASPKLPLPWPRPALGLKLLYGHLAHERCGVEPIDHLWAGSGVPRKFQRVDAGPIEQPEHDRAVAQAVDRAGVTLGVVLEVQEV